MYNFIPWLSFLWVKMTDWYFWFNILKLNNFNQISLTRWLSAISERTLLYHLDPSGNWCRHLHALPRRLLIAGCGTFSRKSWKAKHRPLRGGLWRGGVEAGLHCSYKMEGKAELKTAISFVRSIGNKSIIHLNAYLYTWISRVKTRNK